jgi:serine/threonine protein kinase
MDRDTFLRHLRRSRLLAEAALEEAAQLNGERAEILARALVARGVLTRFQAKRVLAGKPERLVLGQYRLLEPLGRGATGRVFKAVHTTMERVVAVKVILRETLRDLSAVELFNREVRAAAQLHHPNIVTAFDANEVKGTRFLVMEYVNGPSLLNLVKSRGPLPVELACELMRQAAAALQYAHEKGMVHRDVKPGNLLIGDPTGPRPLVKVVDFGLARARRAGKPRADDTIPVEPGTVFGTVDYISPEQAQDVHGVDIRSDLYSLGCTFYHALTGQVPFPGGSPMEKLLKQLMNEPQPIRTLRPEVPEGVEAVVRRLMAKERDQRYQTPAELERALAALAGDSGQPESPPTSASATDAGGYTIPEAAGDPQRAARQLLSPVLAPALDPTFRPRLRQWTGLLELTLRRRALLRKINRQAFAALHRDLMATCRAQAGGASGERGAFFRRLEESLKPWLTPEALAQVDLEIYYQIARQFSEAERELDNLLPDPEGSDRTTLRRLLSRLTGGQAKPAGEAQLRELFRPGT